MDPENETNLKHFRILGFHFFIRDFFQSLSKLIVLCFACSLVGWLVGWCTNKKTKKKKDLYFTLVRVPRIPINRNGYKKFIRPV